MNEDKLRKVEMDMTMKEYMEYLEKTLIPDLYLSGRDYTADDFQRALNFLRQRVRKCRMAHEAGDTVQSLLERVEQQSSQLPHPDPDDRR